MSAWMQAPPGGYGPGQGPEGAPPPAGFQIPPQPGFQQPGYPQPGYPQPGYPQPGYPQPGYPQPGYPQSGYTQPGAPPPYDSVYGNQPAPQPEGGMYGTNYGGESGGDDGRFDFSEKVIRHGFIRKVYGILMCQLLVTLGFIALFLYHEPTKVYVAKNQWLWVLAFATVFISVMSIICCDSVRRKTPMNYIFLGIFTVAESFLLGVFTGSFNSKEIFIGVGVTAAICFALTIFAFQTKWDFTAWGAGLFVCAIVLMIFGILAAVLHVKTVTLVYACLGALLFSFYLIYDTQRMMGGKRNYAISPEEYVFAVLSLYLDIINIFMYIITIIGSLKD